MSNGNETNHNITKFVRQTSNGSVNTQDGSYPHTPKTLNGNMNNNNIPRLFARQSSNRGVDDTPTICRYARQMSNSSVDDTPTICRYAQQMSNSSVDGNNNDTDENSNTMITREPLNYAKYLRLHMILNAVQCLSHRDPFDINSSPVHDEHFFIIIHQVFELWFKAFLFEIDSIRDIFKNESQVGSQLFYINLRLHRSVGIWNMLINMLQHLETMTPVEFLAFRDYVTPASGFQSLQFRIIETKLGLTDKSREEYQMKYFTKTMFKDKQSNELEKSIKEDSLLKLVERWLVHIYDSIESFDFLTEFKLAVTNFINHTKEQKIMNGVDEDTAQTQTKTLKRQFASMLDKDEYNKLLETGERRMNHKAMLAAVMISLYHQQPCFQQCYQMLNLLMDVDTLISSWRHKHVLLVQRQIGRKPGTGGTGGFSYLRKTASEKYQVFIDLFNVSSYLIPQHFLPKVTKPAAEPAASISSFSVQFASQVSIVGHNHRFQ